MYGIMGSLGYTFIRLSCAISRFSKSFHKGIFMNTKVQSKIVFLSYVISIAGSLALNYILSKYGDFYGLVGAIKVSSILTVWWMFYFKLGWKVPLLKNILYRINLSGTWYGLYNSVDSSGNCYKDNIVLRINQDYLSISIISYTSKYSNYSYSEELKYDEKSNTHGLIYVYSQKENSPFDLTARNGTSDLTVTKYKNTYKLKGEFWTIMGSKGSLEVIRVSKKIVDSFVDGEGLFTKTKYALEG